MNQVYVLAQNLSKRFLIAQSEITTLRLIKALLSAKPLKKELWALHDVSFEIKRGEKVALIGKNGSGKTTLLRIISGIYTKTSGVLETKDIPCVFFHSWIGLNQELSVIDNIYLLGTVHGVDRKFIRERLAKIIEFSELRHLQHVPLKNLSSGQVRRLVISVFFQIPAKFFILDESLASVDKSFAQKCEKYLSAIYSSNATVIIASHDMSFLKKYCHRALWLQDGRLRMDGMIEEVITAYEQS